MHGYSQLFYNMAARDLKSFASNNGAESIRLSRSAELYTAPVEAISDGESAHASMPFGRYTSSEVLAMWSEMLKQLNFEEKLKSFYESLMSGLEERHKSTQEKMEQQNQIMQALMHEVCDQILACFVPPQASGQPSMTSSFRPSRPRPHHPWPLYEDSEESTSTRMPDVMVISTDGQFIASGGIQIGGEPTCAVFVSRNDHERTIELLQCEAIKNLSCHVESTQSISDENTQSICSRNNQRLFSNKATNLKDDEHLGTTAERHGNTSIDHDVQDSDEEEVKVKPGFWNRVFDSKDDADSMMMTVKQVKMFQQQNQRLKCEIIELKGTLKEKESLLAEKERTIKILESVHTQASGYIQSGHGHLTGMIAHCGDLTKRIPKVSVATNVGAGNPVQPERPKESDKVPTQDSGANLHNIENNTYPTLEAASTIKEKDKTPEKPPSLSKPVKPEGRFTETKSHTSKHNLKAAKHTNIHDKPVKSSTDSITAGKSEKLDSDDDLKTRDHDLKPSSQQTKFDTLLTNKPKPDDHSGGDDLKPSSQQAKCDALLMKKLKSDDHDGDNKLGTPVDP